MNQLLDLAMATSLPPRRAALVNGATTVERLTTFEMPAGRAPIQQVVFSLDGNYMAVGGVDGVLDIRRRVASKWRKFRCYNAISAITTIISSPVDDRTFFLGIANGNIYKLVLKEFKNRDHIDVDNVNGYIHNLALAPNGDILAVAYDRTVALVKKPFAKQNAIGDLDLLPLGLPPVAYRDDDCFPRSIHFRDNNTVIVLFFKALPMMTFSVHGTLEHRLPLRRNYCASSAISPSGERVVVANVYDGVDFYSTSSRSYMSTVSFRVAHEEENPVSDVTFIDEDHVAIGHADGTIRIITFGSSQIITASVGERAYSPIQQLAFGLPGGNPTLAVVYRYPAIEAEQEPVHRSKVIVLSMVTPSIDRSGKEPHLFELLVRYKEVVWPVTFLVVALFMSLGRKPVSAEQGAPSILTVSTISTAVLVETTTFTATSVITTTEPPQYITMSTTGPTSTVSFTTTYTSTSLSVAIQPASTRFVTISGVRDTVTETTTALSVETVTEPTTITTTVIPAAQQTTITHLTGETVTETFKETTTEVVTQTETTTETEVMLPTEVRGDVFKTPYRYTMMGTVTGLLTGVFEGAEGRTTTTVITSE